jgi:hypothetical protein
MHSGGYRAPQVGAIHWGDLILKIGGSVRLHPKAEDGDGRDGLEGRTATIRAIEMDARGEIRFAVQVDGDDEASTPTFAPQELEPVQ